MGNNRAHMQAAVQLLGCHELHQLRGGILLQIRMLRVTSPAPWRAVRTYKLRWRDRRAREHKAITHDNSRQVIPVDLPEALQSTCIHLTYRA